MLEGIAAGFIYSLTLFPGTVWLSKVGVNGSQAQILAVGIAFWLAQIFWLCIAVPGLMVMYAQLSFIRFGMHLFAAFVLVYMAIKYIRSKRVERIDDAPELGSVKELFKSALNQTLAMPMRLPAAMAILLATGVYINHPPAVARTPPHLYRRPNRGHLVVGAVFLPLHIFRQTRASAHYNQIAQQNTPPLHSHLSLFSNYRYLHFD